MPSLSPVVGVGVSVTTAQLSAAAKDYPGIYYVEHPRGILQKLPSKLCRQAMHPSPSIAIGLLSPPFTTIPRARPSMAAQSWLATMGKSRKRPVETEKKAAKGSEERRGAPYY
ncbi:hypothetical protein B0H65DRAFT_546238 [Neurospora tetraspora]|uniref:Uncharacterized protein n=1 Tax=Neurospora tetraspora TaxID=94610 RepID=A0AAE0JK94_9PEZI|nr:hypothetical protein B0H65DRAFT_546238 [Neurospora tetraspora]